VVRLLTRRFAEKGQPTGIEDVARQYPQNGAEMVGQVGLELLRLQPETYRPQAEDVLRHANGDGPALQALRLALGRPAVPEKKTTDKKAAEPSAVAVAEAEALRGNIGAASQAAARAGQPEDRLRAFVAAAQAIIDSKPTEAAGLLDSAVAQAKAGTPSTWLVVRLCRLLAKAGKFEAAESLVPSLTEEASKSWARLEILRGRLAAAGNGKAEDSWLSPLGDPTKSAAAAKGHEELARHNAAVGVADYQTTVKGWPAGTVRPFGTAGLTLGQQDRDLK
jgi:predicted negative regulator of RcsB-dependent stress response